MNQLTLIPVEQLHIHPQNIRRYYPEADVHSLAANIKEYGLLQSLHVVETEPPTNPPTYYVVDGNMRLAAARTITNCPPLKCEVVSMTMAQQLLTMAITTEFHYPKDPISKAQHYLRLHQQEGLTIEEIAAIMQVNHTTIHNYLDLLELDEPIQQLIIARQLPKDYAMFRLLKRIPNAAKRIELARRFAKTGSSAKAANRSITHVLNQYHRLADQPNPLPPKKQVPLPKMGPVPAADKLNVQKVANIARLHLCEGCRLDGLGQQCYTCPGPYEFINHLTDLLPADLLETETPPDSVVKEPTPRLVQS